MRASVRYYCDKCERSFSTEEECLEHEKGCGPLPEDVAKDMLGRCYTMEFQLPDCDDILLADDVTVVRILREKPSKLCTMFTAFSLTYDKLTKDITMKIITMRHTELKEYTVCGEDKFNEVLNMLAPAVMKMDLGVECLKTDNTDHIQRMVDFKCLGFDVAWNEDKKEFIFNKEEEE